MNEYMLGTPYCVNHSLIRLEKPLPIHSLLKLTHMRRCLPLPIDSTWEGISSTIQTTADLQSSVSTTPGVDHAGANPYLSATQVPFPTFAADITHNPHRTQMIITHSISDADIYKPLPNGPDADIIWLLYIATHATVIWIIEARVKKKCCSLKRDHLDEGN